jgi:transposase
LARELTQPWRQAIRFGVLDRSGLYRKTLNDTLGQVTQVADPFHLANTKLDECRRRAQNETVGPPGPQRRRALPGRSYAP